MATSIDNRVSTEQCNKAATALHSYVLKKLKDKEETELLPGREENVWLVVAVKQASAEKKVKPHKIPIVHPIVDPRTTGVCLITKDPQREYKDLLEKQEIRFISRVVGIKKLKGKFKPYEARRMLLKENGLFLTDERVVPLLPALLGKKFFDAKKQPIPVCLTRKNLKTELERAISSTYMHQNQGTCTSIKIGTMSQTVPQIVENLMTALPAVAKNIRGGWENIQSLNIKTNSSTSLPIWSCLLEEGQDGRWAKTDAEDEEAWGGLGEGGNNDESKPSSSSEVPEKKPSSKKRSVDDATGPQKRKKTKRTEDKVTATVESKDDEVPATKKVTKTSAPSTEVTPIAPSKPLDTNKRKNITSLEKKKGKVVSAKPGKSAKQQILGSAPKRGL